MYGEDDSEGTPQDGTVVHQLVGKDEKGNEVELMPQKVGRRSTHLTPEELDDAEREQAEQTEEKPKRATRKQRASEDDSNTE